MINIFEEADIVSVIVVSVKTYSPHPGMNCSYDFFVPYTKDRGIIYLKCDKGNKVYEGDIVNAAKSGLKHRKKFRFRIIYSDNTKSIFYIA